MKQSIFDSIKPALEPVTFLTRVARYTRFVVFTKFGLLMLTVVMVIYLAVQASHTDDDNKYSFVFSSIETGDSNTPRMMKPKLQGTDNKGQPYNISGDYAIQKSKEEIEISKLQADITLKNGTWISLISESGLVLLDKSMILLQGEAVVFQDQGYEFHSRDVTVDVNGKNAFGDNPVRGQGMPGTIFADKFALDAEKGIIKFDGNVKVTIDARK